MDQPGIFSQLKELRPSKSAVKTPPTTLNMAGLDEPDDATKAKRTKTAGSSVSEKGMLRLLNKFPGGEADDATLDAHLRKVREYAAKMREIGLDTSKYSIPD